jgi:hypothetical protein
VKRLLTIFILITCGGSFCNSQQVASSGGYSMESGVSVDWILGGNFSEIPADVVKVDQKDAYTDSEISCKIYPTLASLYFNIEITPSDSMQFILELYDISGTRILSSSFINQPVQQFDIADLPSGTYILKIWFPGKDQLLQIEKIIKI